MLQLDLDAHQALESQRASLDETQLDILKRVLAAASDRRAVGGDIKPSARPTTPHPLRQEESRPPPGGWQDMAGVSDRKTGDYLVRLNIYAQFAESQKAAYRLALIWLEKQYPGTLHRLADTASRRRRIVARSPQALYPKSPSLVNMAEKLIDDWYVDVNLSRQQKLSRLKIACRIVGLEFGKDLVVDL
ncbi:hypothetical protein AWH62_01710 [Maricaulis sp. W15]|uniref:hypothetical protein n=1 Tax=Maricaulis sp. W15 TaxID=1772333 RepID=UPI000948D3EF|nr:hypothetical protein [Maricaulis sp. W15]OLF81413.1 hypothetical protein AWH62_01710 [Maricaulis sp. W15]